MSPLRPPRVGSLEELSERLRTGAMTATESVSAALHRIAEHDPLIRAWEHVAVENAVRRAGELDATPERGRLHGVPVGVKDIFDTADMPTAYGSRVYAGRRPTHEAWCVWRLRQLGAVLLGKTVTTEFAYFHPGPTRNPRDTGRTPGGSSSGSAAAVAAGMVPVAIGSQTAGSTIRPSAYCGVAGFVPSPGTFPLSNSCALSPTLDTLGLFTPTVTDLTVLFPALGGLPRHQALRRGEDLTLLVCDARVLADLDPTMTSAFDALLARLREHGTRCVELPMTDEQLALVDHHVTIMAYEAARTRTEARTHPELVSSRFHELVDRGNGISDECYFRARLRLLGQLDHITRQLAGADAIILPAATGPAPAGLDSTGDPVLSRPWQALGLPAVSIPGLTDHRGLPLGVQLVGARGSDPGLLAAARAVELVIRE